MLNLKFIIINDSTNLFNSSKYISILVIKTVYSRS